MSRRCLYLLLLGAAVGAACAGPRVSDTGYTGAWSRRGTNLRSTIYIAREGDRYRFKLSVTSDERDGRRIECDWDGHCTEFEGGRKTLTYHFEPWTDPGTGHLKVTYDVMNAATGAVQEHLVDEFVVDADGLGLRALTIERNGRVLKRGAGPQRIFKKVSDAVPAIPGPRAS